MLNDNSTTARTATTKRIKIGLVAAVISLGAHSVAQAGPVNGTGLVTPGVIFGSGNANGDFTGETRNNIEVGLRGKQRYPAANIFNYDGVDTYTFDSTVLTTNPANRSVFNFEWSINVNQNGTSGNVLSDFGYLFSFDTDPTAAVLYVSFNPFATPGFFDHALGTNTTASGGGIKSTDNADLITNMGLFNVAQQSANLGFGYSADPDLPGAYNFRMDVIDLASAQSLSSAEITVLVAPVPVPIPVPAPPALPLVLSGLGLLFGMARRRQAKIA